MSLLLDTQLLLWIAMRPERLSQSALAMIDAEAAAPAYSVASLWEIAIRSSRGREDFQVNTRRLRAQLLAADYREINVTAEHALFVEGLPPIHGDPFDRILLAQATLEGLTLLSADAQLARYGDPVLKV